MLDTETKNKHQWEVGMGQGYELQKPPAETHFYLPNSAPYWGSCLYYLSLCGPNTGSV